MKRIYLLFEIMMLISLKDMRNIFYGYIYNPYMGHANLNFNL